MFVRRSLYQVMTAFRCFRTTSPLNWFVVWAFETRDPIPLAQSSTIDAIRSALESAPEGGPDLDRIFIPRFYAQTPPVIPALISYPEELSKIARRVMVCLKFSAIVYANRWRHASA